MSRTVNLINRFLKKKLSRLSSALDKGLTACTTKVVFPSVFKKPKLIHKSGSKLARFLIEQCPAISEVYRPTVWCYGGRTQTIIGNLIRPAPLEYRRELVELEDGGQIALDWLDDANERSENCPGKPTVLILPATLGNSRQGCILNLVQKIAENGYRVVVFNSRGTAGVRLKTLKTFSGGDTDDLEFVISHVQETYPESPLVAVGFCLGGIILTNYLVGVGTQGKDSGLLGALTISLPFNMEKMVKESLEEPLNHFLFNRPLTKAVHKLIRLNITVLERHATKLPNVQGMSRILNSKSIYEFETLFTAPSFGFHDMDAYFEACNLYTKPLDAINIPLVCLNSADDPFFAHDSTPRDMIRSCPYVVLALTAHGGHLIFNEGLVPTGPGYADRLASQYVKALFEHASDFSGLDS